MLLSNIILARVETSKSLPNRVPLRDQNRPKKLPLYYFFLYLQSLLAIPTTYRTLPTIRCGKGVPNTWTARVMSWVSKFQKFSSYAVWFVIAKVYHNCRPSTVQAMLLLGYREFGIGLWFPCPMFCEIKLLQVQWSSDGVSSVSSPFRPSTSHLWQVFRCCYSNGMWIFLRARLRLTLFYRHLI